MSGRSGDRLATTACHQLSQCPIAAPALLQPRLTVTPAAIGHVIGPINFSPLTQGPPGKSCRDLTSRGVRCTAGFLFRRAATSFLSGLYGGANSFFSGQLSGANSFFSGQPSGANSFLSGQLSGANSFLSGQPSSATSFFFSIYQIKFSWVSSSIQASGYLSGSARKKGFCSSPLLPHVA